MDLNVIQSCSFYNGSFDTVGPEITRKYTPESIFKTPELCAKLISNQFFTKIESLSKLVQMGQNKIFCFFNVLKYKEIMFLV